MNDSAKDRAARVVEVALVAGVAGVLLLLVGRECGSPSPGAAPDAPDDALATPTVESRIEVATFDEEPVSLVRITPRGGLPFSPSCGDPDYGDARIHELFAALNARDPGRAAAVLPFDRGATFVASAGTAGEEPWVVHDVAGLEALFEALGPARFIFRGPVIGAPGPGHDSRRFLDPSFDVVFTVESIPWELGEGAGRVSGGGRAGIDCRSGLVRYVVLAPTPEGFIEGPQVEPVVLPRAAAPSVATCDDPGFGTGHVRAFFAALNRGDVETAAALFPGESERAWDLQVGRGVLSGGSYRVTDQAALRGLLARLTALSYTLAVPLMAYGEDDAISEAFLGNYGRVVMKVDPIPWIGERDGLTVQGSGKAAIDCETGRFKYLQLGPFSLDPREPLIEPVPRPRLPIEPAAALTPDPALTCGDSAYGRDVVHRLFAALNAGDANAVRATFHEFGSWDFEADLEPGEASVLAQTGSELDAILSLAGGRGYRFLREPAAGSTYGAWSEPADSREYGTLRALATVEWVDAGGREGLAWLEFDCATARFDSVLIRALR